MLRRVIVLVMCLAMPFQGAFGATGLLCGPGGHHKSDVASANHVHDAVADSDDHHHAAGALSADDDVAAKTGSQDSQELTGKCKICGECCSTAAAVPASMPPAFLPDTPLRVSLTVDPGMTSRTGDGLFRPPRTTSV